MSIAGEQGRAVRREVERVFRNWQPQAISNYQGNVVWLREQLSRVDLAVLPIDITVIVESVTNTGPYYFEASKRRTSDGETFGVTVRGWFERKGSDLSEFSVYAEPFGGDSPEADGRPVGVMAGEFVIDGQRYWLMHQRDYESAEIVLYRILPNAARVVLRSSLGGC